MNALRLAAAISALVLGACSGSSPSEQGNTSAPAPIVTTESPSAAPRPIEPVSLAPLSAKPSPPIVAGTGRGEKISKAPLTPPKTQPIVAKTGAR